MVDQVGILPAGPAIQPMPAQPTQPQQPQGPNAYDQGADWLKKVGEGFDRFQGGMLQNINDYINPYYDQVISDTLGRMGDQRTKALGQVGDAATNAGAFGGSRHGLMESDMYSQFDRNMTEYVNQANVDKFNNAQNMYMQDMQSQMGLGQGMMGLGNTYLGIGDRIQGQQGQWGQMQQDLMNQIMGGGAGMWGDMLNNPYRIIDAMNGMLGSDPRRGIMYGHSSTTPGLFDYLSLAAQVPGGVG